MSDKTFSAGSEEDFIRQLQEQIAAGSSVDAGNMNLADPAATDLEAEREPEKVEEKPLSFMDKIVKVTKIKRSILETIFKTCIYFIVPSIFNVLLVFVVAHLSSLFLKLFLLLLLSSFFAVYLQIILKAQTAGTTDAAKMVLDDVGKGRLSFDIESDPDLRNTLSDLAEPIDKVIKEMSDIITKIELSVLDIVGNSDALSYFANSMADKTTQQEDSVTKIDNFTKMINEAMQYVKKNVESAYQNSKDSIDEADKSSVEILSLIEEMKSISEMSDKIVETMHLINDIADETNLLALNAAIQAAHAGDEGKGFGVVASEIRNLSESSTSATKSIFQIIDNTVNSIERGVTVSEKAKKALAKIINSIKATEDLMSEINDSINLQSGETDKLKSSVEDIKDLTKNINSDTQNMKSAISNLAGQAQILNGIIKRFEVNASSVGSDAIFGVDH